MNISVNSKQHVPLRQYQSFKTFAKDFNYLDIHGENEHNVIKSKTEIYLKHKCLAMEYYTSNNPYILPH